MGAALLTTDEVAAALAAALLLHTPASDIAELRAALRPACHCSLAVRIAGAAQLCLSGNLLPPVGDACPSSGPSSVVAADASLAGRVMAEGKGRLLRTHAWRLPLKDLQLICAESGCATVVCLPLLEQRPGEQQTAASAPRVLGALTLGFPAGADVSAAVLKRAVLLAHAMAGQQQPTLQEFAGLLTTMLLPQRRALTRVDDSTDCDSSNGEWDWEPSDGETERLSGSSNGRSADGGGATLRAALHSGVRMHPVTLRFSEQGFEHSFAAFHAATLQRIDGMAYLLYAAFICLEVLLPATPSYAPSPQTGWWRMRGRYVALFPGLLLASTRTRSWFTAQRDWMMCFTWLASAAWLLALRSSGMLAPGDMPAPLMVLGLAFQMRLRLLAPLVLVLNAHFLMHMCACYLFHGVLLPLACSYCFEARMRRYFLQHAYAMAAPATSG